MYIVLYKNDPNSTFTAPATTPSVSNYLQIHEGSRGSLWKCQRFQNNIGTGAWYLTQDDPGIPVNACPTSPPLGACTIGNICGDTDPFFGQVWYYCLQAQPTYTYYWGLDTPGLPFLTFGGIIKDVSENITRRAYDLDTSNFEGLSDDSLDEPLIFVLKENDDTYVYSGYVNSWSQDNKVVKFKGVDFKSIFDSEIELDFYADSASVNLQVTTIFTKVFEQFSSHPEINYDIPTITTDTTYIANLLGQVFPVRALHFLKVYLATFGLLIATTFNEGTKEIDVTIKNNPEAATIRLDDFAHTSSKTDTKTNKCVATIKLNQTEEDQNIYTWLKSTQQYYDSMESSMKSEQSGFVIDSNQFIVLGSGWTDYLLSNISGDYFLDIRITNDTLQKIKGWSSTGTPRYWFWVPENEQFIFSSRVSRQDGTHSRVGVGILSTMSDVLFETARHPGNPSAGKDVYLQDHSYTNFGQGWFEGYINNISLPTSTWIRIRIALKGNVSTAFIQSILAKTIIANPLVVGSKDDLKVDFNFDIYDQNWYLRPKIDLTETELPYGYAVKTTDGTRTRYWQLGQVPRQPRPVPKRYYYLGKDNEIYEEKINPANQIFPIKQKIVAEEFLYKAQFNAVFELVNSRYNENIIIIDNKMVNPLELASLELNAMITVYDRQNSVAILPVSEIEIRKGSKSVKLGFKKTFITEVIKG